MYHVSTIKQIRPAKYLVYAVLQMPAQLYQAELIKSVLEEEKIECVLMNKRDSSYGSFGSVEILVLAENVIRAKHLISKMDI